MHFKGRSLYNLLQVSAKEDSSIKAEPWQLLDYRSLSEEVLFKKLFELGIGLSRENFLLYAENCDTPEELLECLWLKESDQEGEERAYLLIFELWRRLFPSKQSLSIFFDDLDRIISQFDEGAMVDEEVVQEMLSGLEDILDQSIDQGAKPEEIFKSVLEYAAHDVEEFLYDYISELLEEGSDIAASKLIDAFEDYVSDAKWFDFLRARLFSLTDADLEDSSSLLHGILEEQEENPDLIFLNEICGFLVHRGDVSLFFECVMLIIEQIRTEGDLQDLLALVSEFYHCLDKEKSENRVLKFIKSRESKDLTSLIHPQDIDSVMKLISDERPPSLEDF